MTEKSNALALAQLLMLHADTIENDSIKNMVIDSATELAVLHDEIERLREALEKIAEVDLTRSDLPDAALIAYSLIAQAQTALQEDKR